jgi:lysophospholipid acyltransferase
VDQCVKNDSQNEVGLNVNILSIETAQNIYEITNNWNICTNEWLKDHIYKRALTIGYSKQTATYVTNVVSATWHGFYPGYIITFVTGGMLTELGRRIREQIRPHFLETNYQTMTNPMLFGLPISRVPKIFYDCVCYITTMVLMAYTTVPFQVFGLYETFAIWKNLYFIGHILMTLSVILLVTSTFAKSLKRDSLTSLDKA